MSQNPELIGVELPAIEFLQSMGWTFRKGSDIKVESRTLAPIIKEDFSQGLKQINPWIDDSGIERAYTELRKINEEDLMHSNRKFWEEFIQKSTFQITTTVKGRTEFKTVRFLDSVTPSNNVFTVVSQFVSNDRNVYPVKPDLLLFVNGLPLGMIECKAAHVKLSNGISQMLDYQTCAPKQFYFNQVCAAINRTEAKYGAIGTPEQFYFKYRLEEYEEEIVTALAGEEPNEQQRLLWALFEPSRFVSLVRHFVLFEQEDFGIVKKLPRYQQWRAVTKTVDRLREDRGGVVWHTQGSGKSLTMGMLARLLRTEEAGFQNPSILLLTDRTDLDRQIFNTFNNIGLHPEQARSVEGLQNRLTNDYGGIFTATIQKFQESKKGETTTSAGWHGSDKRIKEVYRDDRLFKVHQKKNSKGKWETVDEEELFSRVTRIERDGTYYMLHQERDESGEWVTTEEHEVDFQVLSTKKNFYVLVDEAHRSHYGFLGAFLRASLPNAKLVAFTGTPLLKEDKNTLSEFNGSGVVDDYIDVYALQEAVRDGFTLPIRYLDGIAEQTVDGLLDSNFDDKFQDYSESKKALMKQDIIRDRRKRRKRLCEIAEHLVAHYEQNGYAKGFKAMLVCEGRPVAVQYKEILNEIMERRATEGKPVFESRVVISLGGITANRSEGNREEEEKEVATIEERVREAQRKGEIPIAVPSEEIPYLTNTLFKLPFGDESLNSEQSVKVNNVAILIVSDMLLTGYDAPILSTLYLDKPLKEHTLLQAIARVNRTRKGKHAGYIVDYYGIIPHLDAALSVYGGDVLRDQVMKSPERDIPNLQAAREVILSLLPRRHDLLTESEKYKADAEKKLDPLERLDLVEDFLEAVAKFNCLLAMVLPHPAGAPYKPYFIVFNQLKQTLRNLLKDKQHKEAVTAEESRLLSELADEHMDAHPVVSLLSNEIDIFNREEFDQLKRLAGSKAALIMKNQLKHTIQVGLTKEPGFFGELDEELERLMTEEKEGRVEQLVFLEQMEGILGHIRAKDREAHNAGFTTAESIAVFNYLKEETPQMAPEITKQLFANEEFLLTVQSPNWHRTPTVVEELEKLIRRYLIGTAGWERPVAKQHAKKMVERLRAE